MGLSLEAAGPFSHFTHSNRRRWAYWVVVIFSRKAPISAGKTVTGSATSFGAKTTNWSKSGGGWQAIAIFIAAAVQQNTVVRINATQSC